MPQSESADLHGLNQISARVDFNDPRELAEETHDAPLPVVAKSENKNPVDHTPGQDADQQWPIEQRLMVRANDERRLLWKLLDARVVQRKEKSEEQSRKLDEDVA